MGYPDAMITIREAGPGDVDAILRLVRESAVSQSEPDAVCIDAPLLRDEMFGARARVHALLAIDEGRAIGLALYFFLFSTWFSVNAIHLEDLYVDGASRRHGVGAALMRALADVASARGCGRVQWFVQRRNADAIRFYESVGAHAADDWTIMHLDPA